MTATLWTRSPDVGEKWPGEAIGQYLDKEGRLALQPRMVLPP
jgi:hypothetical protein